MALPDLSYTQLGAEAPDPWDPPCRHGLHECRRCHDIDFDYGIDEDRHAYGDDW